MSEREVQHEPQVLEGDDELPRQPAPPTDPFTPEPGLEERDDAARAEEEAEDEGHEAGAQPATQRRGRMHGSEASCAGMRRA